MDWWVYLIESLLAGAFVGFVTWLKQNSDWDDIWQFLGSIVSGVCLLGWTIMLIAVPTSRHYDQTNCYRFGKQTDRTVRFVKYGNWTWQCLTPSAKTGKWIPIELLRSND